MVVGTAVFGTSDTGDAGEIAKNVGFDHPLKYKQITEGAGPDQMSTAAEDLKGAISEHFGKALELLETANRDANVAWQGQAAEQFGNSTKPMTSFLTNAQTTSQAAGESVDRQVEGFLTVRNSMPKPKPIDATDSLAEKGGAWLIGGETDLQQQEREATEAAQAAKQTYDTYDNTIRTETQNPPRFDPPPNQSGEQGQSSFDRSGAINSPMGVGAGGSAGSGGSGGGIGGVGSGSGFGPGGSNVPDTPSGSGSSWAPGGGSTMPAPGPGAIGTGGAGAGAGAGGAGLGMMPGGMGAGGAGAGAGGRAGAGGLGAGGRAGAGAGAANQPGAGGRSGVGTPGAGAAGPGAAGAKGAGAGGRGGAGMGGGAGAGRGAQGGEDDEHEHPSWLEEQDDVWLNDMPRTAPPVFGE